MSDIRLMQGDCLQVMPALADHSVDMICADLPYGTTACSWDIRIPFEPLWTQYKRLIKPRGAIVLFGSQPFTSLLVCSNLDWYKYEMIWNKYRITGFLDCGHKPLKAHESISVFYQVQPTYNPQMNKGIMHKRGGVHNAQANAWGAFNDRKITLSELYYPRSVIYFPHDPELTVTNSDRPNRIPTHPTQKPVTLLEYLIRTYTNEGEMVLDNTMGSGSAMVACVNTDRNGIGIELDAGYHAIAQQRVEQAQAQLRMSL